MRDRVNEVNPLQELIVLQPGYNFGSCYRVLRVNGARVNESLLCWFFNYLICNNNFTFILKV